MTARAAASTGRRERPASPSSGVTFACSRRCSATRSPRAAAPTLLAEVEQLRRATIAFRGTPTAARRATIVVPGGSARCDPCRGRDPRVHLLLPAGEPGRGAPAAARPGASRSFGQAGGRLDRRPGRGRVSLRGSAHHAGADRPPHRGQASRRGRAPVADRRPCSNSCEDLPARSRRRAGGRIGGCARRSPGCGARSRSAGTVPSRSMRCARRLALFDQTIFVTLPAIYREVDRTLDPERCGARPPSFAPFLRWGTWVGGDRDGNPSVTAEVTRAAVAIQIRPRAPGAGGGGPADRPDTVGVRARRAAEPRAAPGVGSGRGRASRGRHRTRPDALRRAPPAQAGARGASARGDPDWAPAGPTPGRGVPHGHRDAATLARGRWRAPAGVGRAAAPAVAGGDVRVPSGLDGGAAAFPSVLATARAEVAEARASRPSPQTREVLATFRAIADIQQRLGPQACERVVVSFTKSAADLAAVLALARVAVPEGPPDVVPVPLFESRHDLANATTILDEWTAHARDAERASPPRERARGDGGLLRLREGGGHARRQPRALRGAAVAWRRGRASTDCELTIFHGRGGALGRGGGPTNRRSSASHRARCTGRFKVTEQGEVAFARYGNPAHRAAAPGAAHERRGARRAAEPTDAHDPADGVRRGDRR